MQQSGEQWQEWAGGLARVEMGWNVEVVRCGVVRVYRAVSEQYGAWGRMGCPSPKRSKKKAPPGQTLFSNFLFSGPESEESEFFSGNLRE